MKAVNQVAHVFPGGLFVWQFEVGVSISAAKYLLDLLETLFPDKVDTICPKGIPTKLTQEDVLRLGRTIFNQFKTSALLILDCVDFLKCAEVRGEEDAVALVALLKNVVSRQDIAVKILATSQESLEWPNENLVYLNGFADSDLEGGYQLFIQHLNHKTKEKMKAMANENTSQLLCDLVTNVNGHPLSLILLAQAVNRPQHSQKLLEDITCDYDTFLVRESIEKEFEGYFNTIINTLTAEQQLILYLCSLFTGPITEEVLSFISNFVDCNDELAEQVDKSIKTSQESLKHLCYCGLLFKRNEEYKLHIGFRENVRHHNSKLKLRLPLTISGSFDGSFLIGIPLENSK
jgi:hypothetical protein